MPAAPPGESFEAKVARVLGESIALSPPDPSWPERFQTEVARLRTLFSDKELGRIAHFGSTAIPGMPAKPIIDMLLAVPSVAEARMTFPAVLEPLGYDFFWRPSNPGELRPYYCWLIGRDDAGVRTHHLHVIEPDFRQWEALYFRDYLRAVPEMAAAYLALKEELVRDFPQDREAYTEGKSAFVQRVTAEALAHFRGGPPPLDM